MPDDANFLDPVAERASAFSELLVTLTDIKDDELRKAGMKMLDRITKSIEVARNSPGLQVVGSE